MTRRPDVVGFGPLTRAAAIQPGSFNAAARTVDLIWTTGAAVHRVDFWSGERYVESLAVDEKSIRLSRLNNSAPFLHAHRSTRLEDVLGVVEPGSARVENGIGTARVRFSQRAEVEPVLKDIQDGILRNVSVGYEVHKYQKTEREGRPTELRAVDWEPFEISAVPMGADDGAKIRAAAEADVRAIPVFGKENPTMEPIVESPSVPETPAAEPSLRDVGVAAERERLIAIDACVAALNIHPQSDLVLKLKRDGTPLAEAQTALIKAFGQRVNGTAGPGPVPAGAKVEVDVMDKRHAAFTAALLHRMNPGKYPLDEAAREARRYSLLDMVQECLELRGIRLRGLSKRQLADRAFEPMPHLQFRVGLHTTSDFANIMADVANKTLRDAYEEAPQTWRPLARQKNLPDFRSVKRNQISEAPGLDLVLEHGEFTRGTMTDAKEEYSLATYGKVLGLSRQLLVNDDLDAFGRNITAFGQSASRKESDIVWFQIMNGKTALMGDGNALFSTAHANFTDTGTAIDVTNLGIGRAAIEKQTGLDGTSYLNLMAAYLIVPTDLATLAQQYTTVVQGQQILTPSIASSVNPFAGQLQVIAEPRLGAAVTVNGVTVTGDAAQWYMAARPGAVDIIEFGYLEGDAGPFIETRIGFDVDGMETKCRLDFAAKVLDWRGLYRNDGAGH